MERDIKTQLEYYRTQAIFWFVMTLLSVIIFSSMAYKRNKELAKKYRGADCVICSNPGNGDHILNFKRIPSRDEEWNMWSLCFTHHREKTDHKEGLAGFVKDYGLRSTLEQKGFYYTGEKFWHVKA